jgi:hypothetical protein
MEIAETTSTSRRLFRQHSKSGHLDKFCAHKRKMEHGLPGGVVSGTSPGEFTLRQRPAGRQSARTRVPKSCLLDAKHGLRYAKTMACRRRGRL